MLRAIFTHKENSTKTSLNGNSGQLCACFIHWKASSNQKQATCLFSLNNSWKIDAPILVVASAERVSPESYGGLCTRRNGACECCWRQAALLTVSSNPVQLGQLVLACAWEEAVSRRERTFWWNMKIQG